MGRHNVSDNSFFCQLGCWFNILKKALNTTLSQHLSGPIQWLVSHTVGSQAVWGLSQKHTSFSQRLQNSSDIQRPPAPGLNTGSPAVPAFQGTPECSQCVLYKNKIQDSGCPGALCEDVPHPVSPTCYSHILLPHSQLLVLVLRTVWWESQNLEFGSRGHFPPPLPFLKVVLLFGGKNKNVKRNLYCALGFHCC